MNAYDPKPLQHRYLQIMTMLVLSGADPEHCVKTHYVFDEYSALSLTEGFLVKQFPVEAGPLLKALRDVIETLKLATSRKRARSVDGECVDVDGCSKRREISHSTETAIKCWESTRFRAEVRQKVSTSGTDPREEHDSILHHAS
jgi:hypothetical protein